MLLLSFPLYSYGMPAQLKALIDRTMPLSAMAMHKVGDRYDHPAQAHFSHIRYVMICGCGFPNSVHNFEGMVIQLELMFGEDACMSTMPESPMFNVPEADPVTQPFLDIVRQAGSEYARDGRIARDTAQKLKIPMIPEDEYAAIANAQA